MKVLSGREVRKFARRKWGAAKAKRGIVKAGWMRCKDCNARATEWDHRNYLRYMDVEPVCRTCNARRGPGFPAMDDEVECFWHDDHKQKNSCSPLRLSIPHHVHYELSELAGYYGVIRRDVLIFLIRQEHKRLVDAGEYPRMREYL